MKKMFTFFASIKLAVVLLLLLLVGLATGTILETRVGAEAAGRMVYYAWWFLGLQALFALNVALSIADLFPWTRKRIGFLVVHASLLLICFGAATSYFLKVEGSLGIWEGGQASVIEDHDAQGNVRSSHQLPFDVKLDQFVLDTYPGTMRPSGFKSRVQITDHATGRTFPAEIWMNHELHYRGYALFQSSYQQQAGRNATVLSVSKDPGQNLVFTGYLTLITGMIIVLCTRIFQVRELAAAQAKGAAILAGKALLALALVGCAAAARAGTELDTLRALPVQHDGRAMPLDTLARQAVWEVTGRSSWAGQDPVATFSTWLFDPPAAANQPVVRIGALLARAGNLASGTTHASFLAVAQNPKVIEYIQQARAQAQGEQPRLGIFHEAEELDKAMGTMQGILQQQAARPIPVSPDPRAAWAPPTAVTSASLAALMSGPRLAGWPSAAQIDTEILYNHLHPTRVAWIILLASLAASLLAWKKQSKLFDRVALGLLVAGFAMMSWGIQLRWVAGNRIPAANMYESMLFLAWGVGFFAVVAYAFLRNRLVVLNAASMATLAMMLTDLLPIDRFIHPIAPVLAGTPWLAIHVPIIMVSYSILALGLVVAHMQIGFTIFAPTRTEAIGRMYDLLYWYMLVGSIFLIAGIITGSMWAASSWGRYWGWDPKEVWSLVAFLAYMAILHARVDKLLGKFGVAAISIVAFQTILMTYLGVNFVLTTGKHSYAMGDSPVLTWMILVALAEVAFLVWGTVAYSQVKDRLEA